MRIMVMAMLAVGCGTEADQCSGLVGVWKAGFSTVVTFDRDGSWYTEHGPSGGWTLSGDTLTIADTTNSCSGVPGTYTVSFADECRQVTLHKTSDHCDDRAQALDGLSATLLSTYPPKLDLEEQVVLPDLAPKKMPDLLKPLDGCNGLNGCLDGCGAQFPNNPSGYAACANDCSANATEAAVTLWVQAYFTCPATKFCGPGHHTDAGTQPCSTSDLDPNSSTVSAACDACLSYAYDNQASAIATACKYDLDVCAANKP